MSKSEAEVQAEVQMHAVADGCMLMRNNSGAFKDETGRVVRFGLGNVSKAHSDKVKSSDLIGFTKITITPEMVGKQIAVFTAIEVKEEGWHITPSDRRAQAQNNFLNWVAVAGGIAFFCNSLQGYKENLGRWYQAFAGR